MTKVYVVTDEDREVLGVATDLAFVKRIVLDTFEDESVLDVRVEKTGFGYEVTVKEDGIRYQFYADYVRMRGAI